MAHTKRYSRGSWEGLAPCDAPVSEHKGNEDHLPHQQSHYAAFRETSFTRKTASANYPPSFVTKARGQVQQITREQQYTEQHCHCDSIVSTKTLLRTFDLKQLNLTMPPTPPQTPGKRRQDMQTTEISPSSPSGGSPQALTCFSFRQPPLPPMQARRRSKFVHHLVKTWDGSYVRTTEWKRPEESHLARTPTLRSNRDTYTHMDRPEYPNPHFGDPCTHEGLEHLLGCGHRIWTTEPQPCASNCHIRDLADYGQIRDLDAPYMCMACIVAHLQATYDSRVDNLAAELETEAARLQIGHDWVVWKIALLAQGWRDEDLQEMKEKAKNGKFCHSLWIEPEWRHLVDIVMHERW